MKRFILDGIPRSGTTAFATALNMHPEAFCALERYQIFANHSRCLQLTNIGDESVPPAFVNEQQIPSINVEVYNHRSREVKAFGNKTPRYYFNALDICRFGDIHYLTIVRDPVQVASSWSRRAWSKNDAWREEDVGLIGLFELLQQLHVLAYINPKNSLLVFYDELFFDGWRDTLGKVLSFLEIEPTAAFLADYAEHIVQPRRVPEACEEADLWFLQRSLLASLYGELREGGSRVLGADQVRIRSLLRSVRSRTDEVVRMYFLSCAARPDSKQVLQRVLTDQSYYFARARFQSFLGPDDFSAAQVHKNAWLSLILFYRTAFAASKFFHEHTVGLDLPKDCLEAIDRERNEFRYVFSLLDTGGFDRVFAEGYRSSDTYETLESAAVLESLGLREDAQILRLKAMRQLSPDSHAWMQASAQFMNGEVYASSFLDLGVGTFDSFLSMTPIRATGFVPD